MTVHPNFNAEQNFIEQMGLITQAEGGPRIAGRIFGLLLVEGRPFSLQEMADRLQVSRASVSTNARMLAERGLLRRTAQAGDRQDYYEMAPTPFYQMLDAIGAKLRQSAMRIEEAEALFSPTAAARQRVHELADFYRKSADFMAHWSEHIK